MSADPRVDDLLLCWEKLRQQGHTVSVEELCRDCPELIDEVRRRIEALDGVPRAAPTTPDCAPTLLCPPPDDVLTAPTLGAPPAAPCRMPQVPGYDVLRELGRGGMGVVYEARQVQLGRRVALKMILVGNHASAAQRQRFRAEVEAVAHLQHPNVVQIHEVGEAEGLPYCALELVDGGSLADRLGGTPQPPREAAELVAVLAEAVQAAHARGFVHRDLKPANVLLTPNGTPKIADFGLAKRLDGAPALTSTGVVLGTPCYMAPEQAAGKKEVGPAADVYALGAILYELLTGRPPFTGTTPLDTLVLVASTEPVPPSRLRPRVPRDLETVCLKCLQKDPARRYARAQDLADDLGRYLKGEPIRARPVPAWERALKWARRRPAAAALLAVSGLAALALLLMGLAYNARLRAQRDAAEANFLLARRVVDEYATTLHEDEHAPAEELRQELLQSTLDFYQEFVHQRGDDPALRAAQGRAYRRLARLSGELGGRESRALPLYYQARDVFEALTRAYPGNADYQQNLAVVHYHLGRAYRDLGQLREAEESLNQARALQQQLLDANPNSASHRRILADIWLALGLVEFDRKGGDGFAEAAYRQALAQMEELSRQQPPTPADEDAVGDVYFRLGMLYHARGQYAQALEANRKALDIEEKLVHDHPTTVNYRADLASSYCGLGDILYAQGRRAAAWEAHQKARAIRERLLEEHRSVTRLAVDLGRSYVALGRQSESAADRREWFAKAARVLQEVLRKEPHDSEARSLLEAAQKGPAPSPK
jgi:tetratricopeptide (TPR) repeat protein